MFLEALLFLAALLETLLLWVVDFLLLPATDFLLAVDYLLEAGIASSLASVSGSEAVIADALPFFCVFAVFPFLLELLALEAPFDFLVFFIFVAPAFFWFILFFEAFFFWVALDPLVFLAAEVAFLPDFWAMELPLVDFLAPFLPVEAFEVVDFLVAFLLLALEPTFLAFLTDDFDFFMVAFVFFGPAALPLRIFFLSFWDSLYLPLV